MTHPLNYFLMIPLSTPTHQPHLTLLTYLASTHQPTLRLRFPWDQFTGWDSGSIHQCGGRYRQ